MLNTLPDHEFIEPGEAVGRLVEFMSSVKYAKDQNTPTAAQAAPPTRSVHVGNASVFYQFRRIRAAKSNVSAPSRTAT